MKRILPLLLVVAIVLSVPLAASAQATISDELKRILSDPNSAKSGGLPSLLVETQGKTKAEKTIKDLGAKVPLGTTVVDYSTLAFWPGWSYVDSTGILWNGTIPVGSIGNSPTGGYITGWWPGFWGTSSYPVDPGIGSATVHASLDAGLKSVQASNVLGKFPTFYYRSGTTLCRAVYDRGTYDIFTYDGYGSWTYFSSVLPYSGSVK